MVFSLALCIAFPAWCWPPEEEKEAWLKAIDEGDVEKLKQMIEQLSEDDIEIWINYRPDHSSMLEKAVRSRHPEIVKLFIEYGADIDGHHADTDTPLSVAVDLRSYEIVKYLLGIFRTPNELPRGKLRGIIPIPPSKYDHEQAILIRWTRRNDE